MTYGADVSDRPLRENDAVLKVKIGPLLKHSFVKGAHDPVPIVCMDALVKDLV